MPRATLNFKLPEENSEYKEAVNGGAWKAIVYELSLVLRNKLKYGHSYKSIDQALEDIKDVLWQECKDRDLDPWSD